MHKLLLSLILPLLFTAAILYWHERKNNKRLADLKIAGIATALFYLSIIAIVIITNHKLKNELHAFDTNGDGFFSGNEVNDRQKLAMRKVISDTGRNFAPIVGIIYSLAYFIIIFAILKIINRIKLIANKKLA